LREESSRSPASVAWLPSDACLAALACYPDVRRIGILTPYQPSADARVRNFFQEADYEVAALHSLKQPSNLGIADADEVVLREGLTAVAAAKRTSSCRSAPISRWPTWRTTSARFLVCP